MKNMTIHALHEKLVQRELTAVALTEAYLKHKDTVEPQIRAYAGRGFTNGGGSGCQDKSR